MIVILAGAVAAEGVAVGGKNGGELALVVQLDKRRTTQVPLPPITDAV